MASKLIKAIRVEAPLLREIMAEFLGTFILLVNERLLSVKLTFMFSPYILRARVQENV